MKHARLLPPALAKGAGFQAGKVHTKWLEFEGADLLKEPS